MRARPSRCSLVLLVAATGCSVLTDEPLPSVRQAAVFEPPRVCVAEPPLAPFAEPVERPSDPQACLPGSPKREVTVELKIVDGRVREVQPHPAFGESLQLDPAILDCMRSSLVMWRYSASPCSGHDSTSTLFLVLRTGVAGRAGAQNAVTEEVER
jgi:hypothetical protein